MFRMCRRFLQIGLETGGVRSSRIRKDQKDRDKRDVTLLRGAFRVMQTAEIGIPTRLLFHGPCNPISIDKAVSRRMGNTYSWLEGEGRRRGGEEGAPYSRVEASIMLM